MLGDLLKIVKVIREKIKDQFYKIYLQYISEKNRNIKARLNIHLF